MKDEVNSSGLYTFLLWNTGKNLLNTGAKSVQVNPFTFKDDGQFPNNGKLPVLLYRNALHIPNILPSYQIKQLFKTNNWANAWTAGVYTYRHYHSNTHEVMAIIKGKTVIEFGGLHGIKLSIGKGDVIIIPAGVAHKNMHDENDVVCLGAYPDGKDWDIKRGRANERPAADKNIAAVPLPQNDPLFGSIGPLKSFWK